VATNSPLIIRVPGLPQPGVPADGLVEAVDLFPTLADLCQLRAPPGLAGVSLTPALQNPDVTCNESAYSATPGGKGYFGHSLRTANYRLVRWLDKNDNVGMVELYDHKEDPAENVNVAAKHPDLVEQLSRQLEQKMAEVVTTSHAVTDVGGL
jgi:iduronate 2-sulfatase